MSRDGWLLVERDGTLSRCPGPARTSVPDRLGHPLAAGRGLARVGLDAVFGATGWRADAAGWIPRNPVGSCLLVSLGGPWEVVGGPVAVTGWSGDTRVAESTAARTLDLSRSQMLTVEFLHRDIMSVLSDRAVDRPAAWVAEIRGFAAWVEAAEVLPRDEVRARVRLAAQDAGRRFLAGEFF